LAARVQAKKAKQKKVGTIGWVGGPPARPGDKRVPISGLPRLGANPPEKTKFTNPQAILEPLRFVHFPEKKAKSMGERKFSGAAHQVGAGSLDIPKLFLGIQPPSPRAPPFWANIFPFPPWGR